MDWKTYESRRRWLRTLRRQASRMEETLQLLLFVLARVPDDQISLEDLACTILQSAIRPRLPAIDQPKPWFAGLMRRYQAGELLTARQPRVELRSFSRGIWEELDRRVVILDKPEGGDDAADSNTG